MTKSELIKAFSICGLGLPSSGETEIADISKYVAYICLTKLENKFLTSGDLFCSFDMDNEIIKFYKTRKNNMNQLEYLTYEDGTKKFDSYKFSTVMVVAPILKRGGIYDQIPN